MLPLILLSVRILNSTPGYLYFGSIGNRCTTVGRPRVIYDHPQVRSNLESLSLVERGPVPSSKLVSPPLTPSDRHDPRPP